MLVVHLHTFPLYRLVVTAWLSDKERCSKVSIIQKPVCQFKVLISCSNRPHTMEHTTRVYMTPLWQVVLWSQTLEKGEKVIWLCKTIWQEGWAAVHMAIETHKEGSICISVYLHEKHNLYIFPIRQLVI